FGSLSEPWRGERPLRAAGLPCGVVLRDGAAPPDTGCFAGRAVGLCEMTRPRVVLSRPPASPVGAASGTLTGWPHPRHLAAFPAHSSGADSTVPQDGQEKRIMGGLLVQSETVLASQVSAEEPGP